MLMAKMLSLRLKASIIRINTIKSFLKTLSIKRLFAFRVMSTLTGARRTLNTQCNFYHYNKDGGGFERVPVTRGPLLLST